jgi:signal peptidase I
MRIEMPKAREKAFVMRVVGLPGEIIEIRSGAVLVDGVAIHEPYVAEANKSAEHFGRMPVPAGRYFVLGDNRRTVMAGRTWGNVREADISGRVRGC